MDIENKMKKEFNSFLLNHEKNYFRPLFDIIRQKFDLHNKRVFDYGCGTGGLLLEFIGHNCRSLTGIDISEPAVQYAQKNVPNNGAGNKIKYEYIDIVKETWSGGKQDIIISNSVLQYAPNLKEVLNALYYILDTSGDICFTIETKSCLSPRSLCQWMILMMPTSVKNIMFKSVQWVVTFFSKIFGVKVDENILNKIRYIGIPLIQNLNPVKLRKILEEVGFKEIIVMDAPKLHRLSAPHCLVFSRKIELK